MHPNEPFIGQLGLSDPMLPEPCRILRVKRETSDIFTLDLEPAAKSFAFLPGQFNMLYVFGTGEVAISISGDPAKPEKLIHTIRSVGTVTQRMSQLKRGGALGVRGPYGVGWPLEKAHGKDLLIVSGGLGLAPLRPAIYSALRHRDRYRRVSILYGTRTPEDVLFPKELEKWCSTPNVDVHVTVDRATPGWHGNVGVATSLIRRMNAMSGVVDPANTIAMVCGPEIMMRFVALDLMKCGAKGENIFISMERNMKCAIGFCGHCQFGPAFVCKDGPVFSYDRMQPLLAVREL